MASDTVNSRIDNCYMHPKKAWRDDIKAIDLDQVTTSPEDEKIAPVITERFNMVINSNYKIDSVPQNGMSHTVEEASLCNSMSQDVPLDFSVKTAGYLEHVHDSDPEDPFSESSMDHRENKMSNNSDLRAAFSNNHSTPIPVNNGKISASLFPMYNGGSKFQRPKQRHLINGSSTTTHTNTQPLSPRLCPENERDTQLSMLETVVKHSNLVQYNQFQNSNRRRPEMNEESSFDANGTTSPRHSPILSRENSPDHGLHANPILHEVLAGASAGRPHARGINSYGQSSNPPETSTKYLQGSMNSLFRRPNSVPPTNMMLLDTGSMLQTGCALTPGSHHMMQAASSFLNNFSRLPPSTLNGINPFGNGSILSPTFDTRMFLTPGDKKQNKPIRPFKAITNDLLYGMPMNSVTQNGGYFRDYYQAHAKGSIESPKISPVPKRDCPETSTSSAINSSPPCSSNETELKPDAVGSGDSNCSYPDASASGIEMAEANSNNRKRGRTLPEELKDEAYWERRRKNNQAAKRSRDARRQKEDLVAQQAWLFREENSQIRFQYTALEEQNQHRKIQLHAMSEQCRNLQLQLRLTNDKLVRYRCGKCGHRMESDISENNFCESNKKIDISI